MFKERKAYIVLSEYCNDLNLIRCLFQIELVEYAVLNSITNMPDLKALKSLIEKSNCFYFNFKSLTKFINHD